MTKDDILRMAREAGLHDPMVFYAGYERFAALVAAAEQDRCCGLIFSWAGSDNVAQRTVDAIRKGP
jgi:hypothetical protein